MQRTDFKVENLSSSSPDYEKRNINQKNLRL